MNKMIAVIISLALIATPALACIPGDPDCRELRELNDGSIDTYFSGSGWNVWFNDMTMINERVDPDYIVEDIWTQKGLVTVTQNIRFEDYRRDPTELILNKYITVDPDCKFDANVEKGVVWDGTGEVYRQAWLGDVYSEASAGAKEGIFVDDIEYNDKVTVFESVGLNTGTICKLPEAPKMPDFPECAWCTPRQPTG